MVTFDFKALLLVALKVFQQLLLGCTGCLIRGKRLFIFFITIFYNISILIPFKFVISLLLKKIK